MVLNFRESIISSEKDCLIARDGDTLYTIRPLGGGTYTIDCDRGITYKSTAWCGVVFYSVEEAKEYLENGVDWDAFDC